MSDRENRRPETSDGPSDASAPAAENWLVGGGQMGTLIRGHDWSATPLGPTNTWPQSLRSAVSILLPSRAQIVLFWGPELIAIYNDAYAPVFGAKHPWAMGRPARECWSEVWHVLGPLFEGVVRTGKAFWAKDHLFLLNRQGFLEETYFDVSYDPVRIEDGSVGGIFCIVNEQTGRVLGERRLRALRELGTRTADAKSAEEVCREASAALAMDPADVPLSLLYLTDRPECRAELVGVAGVDRKDVVPEAVIVDLDALAAAREGRPAEVETGVFVIHAPQAASGSVLVLPISSGTQIVGALVAGVSRHLRLTGDYRDFFDLAAARISAAIANARAYEEERQRAEALAELDRAKTVFFSNVSHEFRTPLTLMLGPVHDVLAQPSEQLDPENRERLKLVHRNGLRLLKLVNTLLDFSRIEAGRVEATYEPTDLAALTADLVSVFRSAAEQAGLKLIVDCPTLSEPVYIDREMWEKIVLNLASNAFKFTFAGEVRVLLRPAGDHVELVVRDTGTGIPGDELPHIFERFHRVRTARGRTHEGTGIGLALVHELVKLHGGAVSVASELERGTTFTVAIPFGSAHLPPDRIGSARTLASMALGAAPYVEEVLRWLPEDVLAEPAPSPAVALATRGAHVLLADDNADMREYLRRLLGQHWKVTAVGDGQAALEAARASCPDLVLTDVMMPRLDGFELLHALRADPNTGSVPVILLSARAGEESRVEGLEAGADDYLVKPFSASELIARVHARLELARVRQEMMRREHAARLEAEQANRTKDEFLAILSHELRTPLNSILGWAVILKRGQAEPDAVKRGLEVIERSARAQSQLIEDLLDVSRIISGKMRLDVRPVDLVAVVSAALDTVRPAAEAKGIRLQSMLDPKAGPIAGDPDRLQQVMWNLLSNAVKFTPKGGQLQIRLERINSHVEAVVSDTGCGISADVLPYVFDRFRQADSTSSRRHGGLGLGLALVKHLVELHGGAVRAESDGPDRGATFVVNLPLMAQVAPEVTAREHAAARRLAASVGSSVVAGLRLLVVDDEPDALELYTKLFTEQGAEVAVARNAQEALRQFSDSRPDVLICDVEMPGEDGYSLIRKVRALGLGDSGSVPAVAVTAYGSVEDRIRLLAAGFQMHVPKPVEPAELLTVVASVAGRTGR